MALYALRAYCAPFFDDITLASFTINHTDDYILHRLYAYQPDIIGFSCAVWNIEKTVRIATLLKKILPSVIVIFGGPEVANQYESYLFGIPSASTDTAAPADLVIPGEGEKPLRALLSRFAEMAPDYSLALRNMSDIAGVAWVDNGCLRINPPETPLDMTELPFPYPADLYELSHKILYYEASRGCLFRCAYCLSAAQHGSVGKSANSHRQHRPHPHPRLRIRPLALVFNELRIFLEARVVRVKFTDRTFNADKAFSIAIWRFLIENDNGVTNFHFEIAADLLDEAALCLLSQARPGLFQFEVGVQSVNTAVLAAVERATDIGRLFTNVARIKTFRNIHLHLDLIVGLPGEDFVSCQESFNQTYAAHPEQLQLGFLKLLKDTPLYARAAEWGLGFSPYPPYEILSTPALSYSDIRRLKAVEEMTEIFHNSGRFTYALAFLLTLFTTPFELFDRLAGFWFDKGYHHAPQSKKSLYEIVLAFCATLTASPDVRTILRDLLRFDFMANEHEKSVPAILAYTPPADLERRVRANMAGSTLNDAVSTSRHAVSQRIVFFETHIWAGIKDHPPNATFVPTKRVCCLRFSYPEPGRQNPFTLAQRVEELVL